MKTAGSPKYHLDIRDPAFFVADFTPDNKKASSFYV
jgi:hypothetical protein